MQKQPINGSKIEPSTRLIIHKWDKGCRVLYGRMGIYAVYEKQLQKNMPSRCLYVGKSIDLGKRVIRFFPKAGLSRHPFILSFEAEKIAGSIVQTHHYLSFFVEVTTISNIHKLDSFERTMIAIKKPVYNVLLNYDKEATI